MIDVKKKIRRIKTIFLNKLSKFISTKRIQFNDYCAAKEHQLKHWLQFSFTVFFYGIIVNFILSQTYFISITIKNIIAYGLIYYVIKVELPDMVRSALPKNNNPPR